ncbi:hypothetical protein Dip510_001273 [Elusimicrobium posterum]|uniref:STN domain-containing protein n=1 Tax=Elusimicrobium posterum TaxID=3116653 RepID=UPI003C72CCB0
MKRSLITLCAFAFCAVMFAQNSFAQDVSLELPKDEDTAPVAASGMTPATGETSLYREAEASSPLDRKVTIRVANVPISTFLNSISAQAKINFIMGEEFANKKITASLTRVTVKEALDTLLRVQGLTYQRIGKSESYVVTKRSNDSPNTITKIYTLNYISLQGNGLESGNIGGSKSSYALPSSTGGATNVGNAYGGNNGLGADFDTMGNLLAGTKKRPWVQTF